LSVAIAVVAASLAVAAVAIALLARHAARLPADAPNARSLHVHARPRGGGLAIWAGFAPAALFAPPDVPGPWPLWIACLVAVGAVSFADDVRGVPAAWRLGVHLAAAAALAWWLADAGTADRFMTVAIIAVAIVWGGNLFNFMDGSDGLAAAMATVGFAALGGGAAIAGAPAVAFVSLSLAVVPFFFVNRPPASMFMGDVGALPLGFFAASAAIAGVVERWWPAWFPLLAFLPFVADATLTLGRRALCRERVWQAHRTHYYQRLNALGAGHRGTLAIYGAAMLACATLALVCLAWRPEAGWAALAAALAGHLIGFLAIDYHSSKRS
jgi:UDP-N-acetylmuramyl pentapeptide phosphotransferase/UDP-N-acetylglucosamine-1-phosphate transferase